MTRVYAQKQKLFPPNSSQEFQLKKDTATILADVRRIITNYNNQVASSWFAHSYDFIKVLVGVPGGSAGIDRKNRLKRILTCHKNSSSAQLVIALWEFLEAESRSSQLMIELRQYLYSVLSVPNYYNRYARYPLTAAARASYNDASAKIEFLAKQDNFTDANSYELETFTSQ